MSLELLDFRCTSMHKNRQRLSPTPLHQGINGSLPALTLIFVSSSVSEKAWRNIYSSYACGCVSACVCWSVWIERPRSIFMALVQQISLNNTVNPQIFYTMSGIETDIKSMIIQCKCLSCATGWKTATKAQKRQWPTWVWLEIGCISSIPLLRPLLVAISLYQGHHYCCYCHGYHS
jgi:hypothetical protein